MNVDLNLDFWISLFDLIILGLLLWGAYKGYSLGAVVQSISLFALLLGLTLSVVITKQIYRFLSPRSDVPDLFAVVFLGITYVFAIWGAQYVAFKVKNYMGDVPKTAYIRGIGVIMGIAKYFLIVSLYVLLLFKVEEHAHFLPEREQLSKFSRASVWTLTKIFPYLKMDKKDYKPFEKPDKNKNFSQDEEEDVFDSE